MKKSEVKDLIYNGQYSDVKNIIDNHLDKLTDYEDLVILGRRAGYKPGWAYYTGKALGLLYESNASEIAKSTASQNAKGSAIPKNEMFNKLKEQYNSPITNSPKKVPPKFYKESIEIAGLTIKEPLVYIENSPYSTLSIAINLAQTITKTDDDHIDKIYIADYSYINRFQKYNYIKWLSEGKNDPKMPLSFVELYFKNLEHRVIKDKEDIKLILFELIRLYILYDNKAFRKYVFDLIGYILLGCNETYNKDEFSKIFDFFRNHCHINISNEVCLKYNLDSQIQLNSKNIFDILIGNSNDMVLNLYRLKFDKEPLLERLFLLLFKKSGLKAEECFDLTEITQIYEGEYKSVKYSFQAHILNFDKIEDIFDTTIEQMIDFDKKRGMNDSTKKKLEKMPLLLQQYFTNKKSNVEVSNVVFSISKDKLNKIKQDTNDVKDILTKVFVEEEEIVVVPQKQDNNDLDIKYLNFIDFIKTKEIWDKKELTEYCKTNKLMLNDTISTINEYYDEKCGEYLIEDDYTINLRLL
ncbi:MAG: hypothetical protein Ta2D_06450 [Rickettsiales bacterium]|nr:MAG: hypothetical protein Ta2D_06450 [Rickettsiales bacterium]